MSNVYILRNEMTNSYPVYYNLNNKESLWIKFSDWDLTTGWATEVTIAENTLANFEVLQVDVVKQPNCSGGLCNELHIKGKIGNQTAIGPPPFKLNLPCDLDNTVVFRLIFSKEELEQGLEKNLLCHDCYGPPGIPDVKEGNVVVGFTL